MMRFFRPSSSRFLWLLLAFSGLAAVALAPFSALATSLPQGLQRYVFTKDANAQIRFDGLIQLSNGMQYVPVFPQGLNAKLEPGKVIQQWPEATPANKKAWPEIIQFDNNLFLLRLMPANNNKLTLPRLAQYPLALKEGLLPEDFVLPEGLSIPAELKVILGKLNYTASTKTLTQPAIKTVGKPPGPKPTPLPMNGVKPALTFATDDKKHEQPLTFSQQQPLLYVADLNTSQVLAVKAQQGSQQGALVWRLGLNGLPSELALSPNGQRLYVGCLGRNELAVIDTQANLVTQRIKLDHAPDFLVSFWQAPWLATAGKLDKKLSVVSTTTQQKEETLELPATVLSLTARPDKTVLYATEGGGNRIFEVDVKGKQLVRTLNSNGKLPYFKDASAAWVQPQRNSLGYLWLLTRKKQFEPIDPKLMQNAFKAAPKLVERPFNLQIIDLMSGAVTKELLIGKKPIGFFAGPKQTLYIPCAESDRIEVLDTVTQTLKAPITLPVGTFPSSVAFSEDGELAYVASTGNEKVLVLDLTTGTVEKTLVGTYRPVALLASSSSVVAPKVQEAGATTTTKPGPAYLSWWLNNTGLQVMPTQATPLVPISGYLPEANSSLSDAVNGQVPLTPVAVDPDAIASEALTPPPATVLLSAPAVGESLNQPAPEAPVNAPAGHEGTPKRPWVLWPFAGRAPR